MHKLELNLGDEFGFARVTIKPYPEVKLDIWEVCKTIISITQSVEKEDVDYELRKLIARTFGIEDESLISLHFTKVFADKMFDLLSELRGEIKKNTSEEEKPG